MSNLNFLYNSNLPSRAVMVYLYLHDMADKNGQCYPSVSTIAYDLKISCSTVRRAIADLQTEEFLKIECRYRAKGGNSSNLYALKILD